MPSGYEESALKHMAHSHGERKDEIEYLLRQKKLVDLYVVVREAIQISEPKYSLKIKNLEVFYMQPRAGEVKSADASVVVYERWLRLGEQRLIQEIADDNEADCRSTIDAPFARLAPVDSPSRSCQV